MTRQIRLYYVLGGVFFILLLFSLIYPLYKFNRQTKSAQVSIALEGQMDTFIIAQGIDHDVKIGNWSDVQSHLRRINSTLGRDIHLQVIEPDGTIVADNKRIEPTGQSANPIIQQAYSKNMTISQQSSHIHQVAMPLSDAQDEVIAVLLYEYDWDGEYQKTKNENFREMLTFFSMTLLISVLVLFIVWFWITHPLDELYGLTIAIASGAKNQRAPAFRITEFHQVGVAINQMLDNNAQKQSRLENEIFERKFATTELERHQNELENLVEERTIALKTEIEAGLQIAQVLRESEARYREIVELSPDAIAVHRKGRIIYMNPAGLELLAAPSLEEIIDTPIGERVHPEYHEELEQRNRTLMKQDTRLPLTEAKLIRFDGVIIHIEVVASSIQYEGERAILSIFRDISEQKDADQNRIRLLMEQERTQLLTQFITQASHEFRTPLSIIGTSAHLLQRSSDLERQIYHFNKIIREIDNITKLVNDLTLMAALDQDSHMNFERLDINKIVERTLHEFDVEIQTNLSSHRLMFLGNPQYLERAIQCVVRNAVEFTPDGGEIGVQTRKQGYMVVIEVRDSGQGIKEEDLPHIFERFYRNDKVGKTRGLGLGLPIAKRVIEQHKGSIEVESETGKGSTFTISLPLGHSTQELIPFEDDEG